MSRGERDLGANVIDSVSIVINNYNYAEYLRDAIDSALNQTASPREVIVVDDGSTDDSRAIIRSYGDRIIPVFQENGGQRKAYNSGFRLASGELILFLDADDALDSTALEEISRAWKPGASKLHFPLRVANSIGADANLPEAPAIVPQDRLPEGDLLPAMLSNGYYLSAPGSGNVYSRQFLTEILPMSESSKYCADTVTIFSAPFYGKILAIHHPLGIYRVHQGNGYTAAETSSKDIRRFLENDWERVELIALEAEKSGMEFSRDCLNRDMVHLKSRLALLRLDSPDRAGTAGLALRGMRAALTRRGASTRRKLFFIGYFAALAMVPNRMVRGVVSLGFAKTGGGLPDVLSRAAKLAPVRLRGSRRARPKTDL
jgi:glycosyltransferase involved in cell wall biosynthesis